VVGNAGYPGYDEPGVRDLDDPADLLCDLNPGLDRRGGREAASASTQNPRVEIIKYSFQKYIFSSFNLIRSYKHFLLISKSSRGKCSCLVMSVFRKGSCMLLYVVEEGLVKGAY